MRRPEKSRHKRLLKDVSNTSGIIGRSSVFEFSAKRPRATKSDGSLQMSSVDLDSPFSLSRTSEPGPLTVRLRSSSKNQIPHQPKLLVHFEDAISGVQSDNRQPSIDERIETTDSHSERVSSASRRHMSGFETDSDPAAASALRELRPRVRLRTSTYTSTRPYRRRNHDRVARRPLGRSKKTVSTAFLHNVPTAESATEGNEASGEDEVGSDQEKSGTDGDTRRYPVRNRRHTAVYQVEYPQNNHGSTRNWLAGTGHENGGRRRSHKTRPHRGLQRYGSSTSSSMDSDSGSFVREPRDYQPTSHTSWRHGVISATGSAPPEVDEDELRFARRCTKSIIHSRSELLPLNMTRTNPSVKSALADRLLSGTSLADIEPMRIDNSVGFEQVGGHSNHIMALKESIILPLMYPEVFSQFGVDPPRGVLFSGPPGTGKTLLARALANECTRMAHSDPHGSNPCAPLRRPIAFFMRKGADCLSKWVGESERQLRLLFDQAYRLRPSIIFFDEIDGLAPVRSSKQDQIHSSIVSTLLSLMDGLDNRAEVVIIGATNRPDAIDPALRRPGRFDREFVFTLPCDSVRLRILEVHTTKWNPKPDPQLLKELAHATVNFSGADLKALTTEAFLCCLRRQYPQVYRSQLKLALEHKYLVVSRLDWLQSLQRVRPAADRSDADACSISSSPAANALSTTRRAPLCATLTHLLETTMVELAQLLTYALRKPWDSDHKCSSWSPSFTSTVHAFGTLVNSKILFTGDVPDCLMDAIWHRLEHVQVFTLSYANLVALPTCIGVCPEAAVMQFLSSVKRATVFATSATQHPAINTDSIQGVVIYLPHVDLLLNRLSRSVAVYLFDRFEALVREFILDDYPIDNADEVSSVSQLTRAVAQRSRRVLIVATLSNPTSRIRHHSTIHQLRVTSTIGSPDPCEEDPTCGKRQRPSPNKTVKLCNGLQTTHRSSTRSNTVQSVATTTDAPSPTFSAIHHSDPWSQLHSEPDSLSLVSSSFSSEDCAPSAVALSKSQSMPDSVSPRNLPDPRNTPNSCTIRFRQRHRKRLLKRFFSRCSSVRVHVDTPSQSARAAFFNSVLKRWPVDRTRWTGTAADTLTPASSERPPSPLPLVENAGDAAENARLQLSSEQLAEVEREEAQLFRRLRQVLRRVVAHLARHRRFAVFTRPVQTEEAPDYYEVIKNPMDLGSIRDRIDARHYTNVEDFMNDIELIYHNALEYNPPNVPRSHDIRSRASEFWDEACLQIEEELHPPDLNDRCKAATWAQQERATHAKRSIKLPTESHSRSHVHKPPVPLFTSEKMQPEPVVKLYPMPQGGRYSRRLHGQPPVLGNHDIQVLQSVTGRRTSLSIVASSPESKLLRDKLGLSVMSADLDQGTSSVSNSFFPCESHETLAPHPGLSASTPSEMSFVRGHPCSKTISPIVSPDKCVTVAEFDVSASPNLSSTVRDPHMNTSVLDQDVDTVHLEQFTEDVITGTLGWSVEQLLRLHREFLYTIFQKRSQTTGNQLSDNLTDLQRVFKAHTELNQHG